MADPPTEFDKTVRWFKDHRAFSIVLVVGVFIIAIGSLTDAITKIGKFFAGEPPVVATSRDTSPSTDSSTLPLEPAIEYFFNGSDSILTVNAPTNPLLAHAVVAVYQTATTTGSLEGYGLIGESAVRKTNSDTPVSLNRYAVEVTNFLALPKCRQSGASRGAAHAIEATFLLSNRGDTPFPWYFDADEVVLKTTEHTQTLETPYNMTGSDLVALRYFINAKDPGIYFVHCVTYVLAKGSTTPIRIPLHDDPIPIAFYELDESEPASTEDWIEFPQRD